MKVLAVCPMSNGPLGSLIGIAHALRTLGHTVTFATSSACERLLGAEGFPLARAARPADDAAMVIDHWAVPDKIRLQVGYLRDAIAAIGPDVVLASTFSLGALLAARQTGVPIVVVGLAVWLWPCKGQEPGTARGRDCARRLAEALAALDGARRLLAMADPPTAETLLGDRFLLQSLEALSWPNEQLPESVVSVGPCLWEPSHRDDALERFLAVGDRPVIYAQPGRTFGDPGFWPALVDGLRGSDLRVVASVGRLDGGVRSVPPAGFFVRQHVPQGAVLPAASLMVTTGHATGFLGAVRAGVPLVCVPSGSGSREVAALVEHLGIGRKLSSAALDGPALRRAIEDLLADLPVRARAEALARRLAPIDGCRRAAEACVALGP